MPGQAPEKFNNLSTKLPRMKNKITRSVLSPFGEGWKDLLGAEHHLLVLFPLLKNACSRQPLRNMMARSLDNTREHITRLEQIGRKSRLRVSAAPPEAILSLAREAEELIGSTPAGSVQRDAGCVRMAQEIQGYQIGIYSSLAELARDRGMDEVLELLETSLNEEKETEEMLAALTEHYIDAEAGGE